MSDTNDPRDPGFREAAFISVMHALMDPTTQAQVVDSLLTLVTLDRTRRHSTTMAELQRIDTLRREAWSGLPMHVRLAIRKWEAELVGMDPAMVLGADL